MPSLRSLRARSGSGSVPKCNGSRTLPHSVMILHIGRLEKEFENTLPLKVQVTYLLVSYVFMLYLTNLPSIHLLFTGYICCHGFLFTSEGETSAGKMENFNFADLFSSWRLGQKEWTAKSSSVPWAHMIYTRHENTSFVFFGNENLRHPNLDRLLFVWFFKYLEKYFIRAPEFLEVKKYISN